MATSPTSSGGAPVSPAVAAAAQAATEQAQKAVVKEAAAQADSPVAPAKPTALFQIKANDEVQRYLKALVYGEYGSGKTWWCGTSADVPALRDVLLISAESGHATLEDDAHAFGMIDIVQTTNYKTVARVYDFLKLHCSIRDRLGQHADISDASRDRRLFNLQSQVMPDLEDGGRVRAYRTVIIDSLTEVEVYCMNQLLGVNDATKIDEESAPAEWAQYRVQHTMVQRLIRNFRDLPMHVLFTCARSYVQDETKRMIYSPMMTGKLSGQVQGFMDMVGYLVMGAPGDDGAIAPRRMYIQPAPRYAAKARFSNYKKGFFDNPTVGSVLADVGWIEASEVPGLKRPAAKPKE